MTQNDFVEQAIKLIFAVDADGYPLPSYTKITQLQILTMKYENAQKEHKHESSNIKNGNKRVL